MGTGSARTTFAVTDEGPRDDAHPLVMVHGFGTDQHVWDDVVPALVADRRVIRLDNAGAGGATDAFVGHRYLNLSRYALDLLDVLEELEVDDVTVIGHSAGAMIALLAAVESARISRLALIGASPRYLDDSGYRGGMSDADVNAIYTAITLGYDSWAEGFAPLALQQPADTDKARAFADCIKAMPVERTLTVLCSIFQSDHRASVARVQQPTLIVQTKHDPFVPIEVAAYLRDHIPDSRLEVIDAVGHLPQLTAPELLVDALRPFV